MGFHLINPSPIAIKYMFTNETVGGRAFLAEITKVFTPFKTPHPPKPAERGGRSFNALTQHWWVRKSSWKLGCNIFEGRTCWIWSTSDLVNSFGFQRRTEILRGKWQPQWRGRPFQTRVMLQHVTSSVYRSMHIESIRLNFRNGHD